MSFSPVRRAAVLGGRRSLDADTVALIARMTGVPTGSRVALLDTTIRSLKNAGLWPRLDALQVQAAHDAQASRLNWKGTTHTLSPINSPAFLTDQGYKGDGTSSLLDSGAIFNTAGSVFSLNDCHFGVWLQENTASSTFPIGVLSTTLMPRGTTDVVQVRGNAGATVSLPGNPSGAFNHFALNRASATAVDYWADGVKRVAGFAQATTTISSLTVAVCGRQTASGAFQYDPRRVAASHWGASLTDQQHADLRAILAAYMTAVGAL